MKEEPIGVFVIVQRKKDRAFLLGVRENSYKSGWYGFPGGRLKPNELLADGAARELQEETGLKIISQRFIGVIREFQITHTFIHFAFICRSYSGIPTAKEPSKCRKWTWFPKIDHSLRLLPGHRAALSMLDNPKTPGFRDII